MNTKKLSVIGLIAIVSVILMPLGNLNATTLVALPDPLTNAVLYGNAYSYSLPLLAFYYDQQFGGGVGPGNPYYIASGPGQIDDDIVVATGVNGGPTTTNITGMNDAYSTPSGNGGLPYFSTGQTGLQGAAEAGLLLNNPTTWNTNIGALQTYLGGTAPVFFFNNNQINSGDALNQQLVIWGQAILVSSTDAVAPIYFTLANNLPPGNVGISGSEFPVFFPTPGGIVIGPDKDPSLYSRGAPTSAYPLTSPGSIPAFPYDFVLSGGQDCLDNTGTLVSCTSPSVVTTINHNLGANQAAYAVIIPGLNDFLASWDSSSPYDVLELDVRMGCNPDIVTCPLGWELNNGYEQLFIGQGTFIPPPPIVPEPGTMLLLGSGLIGISFWRAKKSRKS